MAVHAIKWQISHCLVQPVRKNLDQVMVASYDIETEAAMKNGQENFVKPECKILYKLQNKNLHQQLM